MNPAGKPYRDQQDQEKIHHRFLRWLGISAQQGKFKYVGFKGKVAAIFQFLAVGFALCVLARNCTYIMGFSVWPALFVVLASRKLDQFMRLKYDRNVPVIAWAGNHPLITYYLVCLFFALFVPDIEHLMNGLARMIGAA